MNKPTDRTIFQNAWVVPDIESACMKWVNELGIGPFFLTDYTPGTFENITYRGEPSDLSMKVAIAQAGNVQIELIEPTTDQCAYRDSVPEGQMAFHHMCVWTLDFEADLKYMEGLDYAAANTGKVGDVEFAYFDTRPLMGCMLEVVTKNEGTVARFENIAETARYWDGKDPIRQ
jgi:methylmalonyl-CoA/ethylmalonyl-CoA epimerase|tara:strand:- start:3530 stop:4051 length:522 start_codon:yes stop_codon:yes gene_type:complete